MTTFVFTDEQQDLREMVRRFLAEKSPVSEVRRLMATEAGYDPAVWAQFGRLGLAALTIPEKYGGASRGPVEQLIVCEEMGAALLCAPYLASAVLAAWALLASGDVAAQADLLPGMAAGETIATLAVPEDDGSWEPDQFAVTARRSGDRYLLDGRKSFVLDGMIADLILVAASSDDGPALVAVDGDAPGLSRRAMQTLDMTRKQAVLTFSQTPGRVVGRPGAAAEIVAQAVRGGVLALAAEQVGGAQRCLDMAVAYAKVRHQFGRAIGSFQAIKHMCADMLLEVESARSAAYRAAWAAADGDADLPLVASLAKAYCSEAYCHVSASNIQVHGGIGFTWEHDAHLYYRRAKSAEVMLGTPASHREIAAGLLLKDSGGLSPGCLLLRRGGLDLQRGVMHDLGRTAIPNSIWDKPGALTRAERDRVHLHPVLTEQMLHRAGALDALSPVAACHHEKADGSGYAKGLTAGQLSPAARILGAADRYQAMTQHRAHRPALSPQAAAAELRRMAAAGEVDGDAAECVLAAAGHPARRGPAGLPAGLTVREAEVLALRRPG